MNPTRPGVDAQSAQVREAARALGLPLHILNASSERDSLSPGDEVPHMFTRKPRLQLEKLRSTVQKDFCNKIGTVRTAFSQLRLLSNLPHPSASGRVAVMLSSLRPAELLGVQRYR
jgi:hypothetical protein